MGIPSRHAPVLSRQDFRTDVFMRRVCRSFGLDRPFVSCPRFHQNQGRCAAHPAYPAEIHGWRGEPPCTTELDNVVMPFTIWLIAAGLYAGGSPFVALLNEAGVVDYDGVWDARSLAKAACGVLPSVRAVETCMASRLGEYDMPCAAHA